MFIPPGFRFDEQAQHAFVGDVNGGVSMLKLSQQTCTKVTSFNAHSGAIRCLAWDSRREMLYSASNDQIIICWDIGGKRGTAYELLGHTGRVSSIAISLDTPMLLSAGEDRMVISWNMRVKRKEVIFEFSIFDLIFKLGLENIYLNTRIYNSDTDLAGK